MVELATFDWAGASGRKYTYWIYELPAELSPRQIGNYIYAKMETGNWKPLYIGQGDLKREADIELHPQSRCLGQKGATHVHVHINEKDVERAAEKGDLLRNFPQTFQPGGCNERR